MNIINFFLSSYEVTPSEAVVCSEALLAVEKLTPRKGRVWWNKSEIMATRTLD